jgi:hypothetical protein
VKIETIDDVIAWHRERAEMFSHGGLPWGAMANESFQIVKILEQLNPFMRVKENKETGHGDDA